MGSSFRKFTPALVWRAFFVCAAGCRLALAAPPSGSQPPPLVQLQRPNAAEVGQILDRFRNSGWFGYIEFDLHALPRRGDETVYHGRLWGGRDDEGPVSRIEVVDQHGATHRFLLQNGQHAAVWRLNGDKVERVAGSALFDPLIPGVEVTAFDMQMPYLYWPGVKVGAVTRIRGRPAYEFVFPAPPSISDLQLGIALVRAYFDAQFSAPVQTELADAQRVLKTTSLLDLKKVGEQWIPKSFDIRNEVTRDKTRFEVTAVALNLRFPPTVFTPTALTQPVAPPAADRIVPIGQ
ncbi:MAG TPA: outer membrane lipoprotein-sorting protein [Opitutaceae bacterium]|nr:outer membrane lipoprotein-sorting protein [Opitutaceae bacterium]